MRHLNEWVDEWMNETELRTQAKFIFSVALWAPERLFFFFFWLISGFLANFHMREIALKEKHSFLWHLLQDKEPTCSEVRQTPGARTLLKRRVRVNLAISLLCLFELQLPACYFFFLTGFYTYIYPGIIQETANFICPFGLLFLVKSIKANY